jgi:amino acid adenylation domain-containing protein
MTIKELLKEIRAENIDLCVIGDNLQIKGKDPDIPKDLFEKIRDNKAAIITYLRENISRTEGLEAIRNTAIRPSYVLSSSQLRLWVLFQVEESNTGYNMPEGYILEGVLNRAAMESSFFSLIERHEILRTVFRENDEGEVRQFIVPTENWKFNIGYRDLRAREDGQRELKNLISAESQTPFDLKTGPLMRVNLYQVEDRKWILTYTLHHIVCDGWTMGVLTDELFLLYNAYVEGRSNPLIPLRIQYKDYAAWQREQLSGEALQEHKRYWLTHFEGTLPVLELPADRPRPVMKSYKGGVIRRRMPAEIYQRLKQLVREQRSTLFMGLLASVKAILYRYSGQTDMIVGSAVAGREHADLENQIGFYVNMLALRTRLTPEMGFRDLLAAVREVTLAAYEHQVYPFDELVRTLRLERDMSRSPLFDVVVNFHDFHIEPGMRRRGLDGLTVSSYESMEHVVSKFDLSFVFAEAEAGIDVLLEYNNDLFEKRTVERLLEHWARLCGEMLKDAGTSIGLLDYMDSEERKQLMEKASSQAMYPEDKTIIDLFEKKVKDAPDNIAVAFDGTTLTYKELNETANQLGNYLRINYAIQPDDLIAIRLDRSEWMVIALLGVLKSGGAYVPIDPDYRAERVEYMLADSNCKVLVDIQEMAKFKETRFRYDKEDLVSINKPADLAYVIYTSGTTGRPKGSLIEHRNVVRLFLTDKPLFDFGDADTWTMFHSYCFDFSVWEMYGALLFGAKLIVVPLLTAKDPGAFLDLLYTQEVTVLNQTPSAFYNLIRQEPCQRESQLRLRYVIFGGEALRPASLKPWKQRYPAARLINMYGITETTVHVTFKEITQHEIEGNVNNIGRPIPTLSCYVLDPHGNLTPVGVPGELYVGGEGVCRGYLNREELTRHRFIASPFTDGERLYRSGDLVKMMENGEMEYLGRIDDQIKIRGYRVELGEIESVLHFHPDVDMAVVVARPVQNAGKEIVAYLVGKKKLNISSLHAHITRFLPAYMLPARYVQMDKMPLTTTGKVDRGQLPDPVGMGIETGRNYVAPRNELEERLVSIWQRVLGVRKIGILDNFFEVGGNSMNMIPVTKMMSNAANVEISMTTLFKYGNIRDLVDFIMQEPAGTREVGLDRTELMNDLNKFKIQSDVNN